MYILSWNINGLKRKIAEHDFLQYIYQYDIVFLSETWLSKTDSINLDINGYLGTHISGNKSQRTRKGRYSGGISVYYRTDLKNYVTVLEIQQCGILWLKLSSALFPFDEDVYLCNVYIPPSTSNVLRHSDIDIYDQIETGIIRYNNIGKVFVTGDLNGRTSDSIDYLIFDKYLDQNVQFLNSVDIPLRKSRDCITDFNGLKLLNLCQSTGLLIANGRLHSEINTGKYTFCSHSVVDYMLLNFLLFFLYDICI